MGSEHMFGMIKSDIKASGRIIACMAKVSSLIKMDQLIKDNIKMIESKVKEYLNGQMEEC